MADVVKRRTRNVNRRNRHRLQLAVFLIIVTLVTLALLYMFTSISYVSKVKIKGNELITDNKVMQIINIDQQTRIYSLPVNKMEQNLKLQDGVKAVDISRHFPNQVEIDIDEYEVVGMIADGRDFHPLLENGQVLKAKKMSSQADAPIVTDFNKAELNQLVKILNHTSKAIRNNISEINFVPNEEASSRVQFFMNDGLEIIGDLRTIGDKLNYYPSMESKIPRDQNGRLLKPGMIDLEIGAVFIPYESEKAEARRVEMESEAAAKKSNENKKLESSIDELKKQLDDIKKKSSAAESTSSLSKKE